MFSVGLEQQRESEKHACLPLVVHANNIKTSSMDNKCGVAKAATMSLPAIATLEEDLSQESKENH